MRTRRAPSIRGYSLLELLVVLTLTGLVVAGIVRALSVQKRFYARQSHILDARHALRASATLLNSELRETSPGGGDLYFIAEDSVGFRSTVGFGLICAIDGATLSLDRVSGHFEAGGGDSLLVFVEETSSWEDDHWQAAGVDGISDSSTPACASGRPAQRVVTIEGSMSGLRVGAPARLFRPYVYGLFSTQDGRWWLGRRPRSAGAYVPVAGPLAPPSEDGLRLIYRGADDQLVTNPAGVERVEITIRAPTFRSVDDPGYDDLATSVYLRNDG